MTIHECYAAMGGDYEKTAARFPDGRMLKTFALAFLDDGSFDELTSALADNRTDDAFRAAHTLKGLSLTLGLAPLSVSAAAITEALREGEDDNLEELYAALAADYALAAETLTAYKNSSQGD